MRTPPLLDMTPDGRFVNSGQPNLPRGTSLLTIVVRLAAFIFLVTVAAVAFWAALFIIPALILLGALSYAVLRLFGPRAGVTVRRFR